VVAMKQESSVQVRGLLKATAFAMDQAIPLGQAEHEATRD